MLKLLFILTAVVEGGLVFIECFCPEVGSEQPACSARSEPEAQGPADGPMRGTSLCSKWAPRSGAAPGWPEVMEHSDEEPPGAELCSSAVLDLTSDSGQVI